MGVDASFVYGYMAEKDEVEWDIEYLKSKFNLNEKLTGYLSDYTYGDLIDWLENDEIDDWDDIEEILGVKQKFVYDDQYLYFTHKEIAKRYPYGKLGDLEQLAEIYAKESGIANVEIFKWSEFGYFD